MFTHDPLGAEQVPVPPAPPQLSQSSTALKGPRTARKNRANFAWKEAHGWIFSKRSLRWCFFFVATIFLVMFEDIHGKDWKKKHQTHNLKPWFGDVDFGGKNSPNRGWNSVCFVPTWNPSFQPKDDVFELVSDVFFLIKKRTSFDFFRIREFLRWYIPSLPSENPGRIHDLNFPDVKNGNVSLLLFSFVFLHVLFLCHHPFFGETSSSPQPSSHSHSYRFAWWRTMLDRFPEIYEVEAVMPGFKVPTEAFLCFFFVGRLDDCCGPGWLPIENDLGKTKIVSTWKWNSGRGDEWGFWERHIIFSLLVFSREEQCPTCVNRVWSNSSPKKEFEEVAWSCRKRWSIGKGETVWVFPRIGIPQIIHFNRVFHYKPSILGYPYFWKHPYKSFRKLPLFKIQPHAFFGGCEFRVLENSSNDISGCSWTGI